MDSENVEKMDFKIFTFPKKYFQFFKCPFFLNSDSSSHSIYAVYLLIVEKSSPSISSNAVSCYLF